MPNDSPRVKIFSGTYHELARRLEEVASQLLASLESVRMSMRSVRIPAKATLLNLPDFPRVVDAPEWSPASWTDVLEQARHSVEGIADRIGGPLRIGCLGNFSSGKSSLLNNFLLRLLGAEEGDLPEGLAQPTGLEPTTKRVTAFVHKEQDAEGSAVVQVVRVDQEVFKTINLFDTPGNDETLNDRVALEYLSHLDVILYLFAVPHAFTFEDMGPLQFKAKHFRDTPTVFVLSRAWPDLVGEDGDLDVETTGRLVASINQRIGRAELHLDDRNTFVIDNEKGFGVDELLQHLLETYGSTEAGQAKLRLLGGQLREQLHLTEGILDSVEEQLSGCSSFTLEYVRHAFAHAKGEVRKTIATETETVDRIVRDQQLRMRPSESPLAEMLELRVSVDAFLHPAFPQTNLYSVNAVLSNLRDLISQLDRTELVVSVAALRERVTELRDEWTEAVASQQKGHDVALAPLDLTGRVRGREIRATGVEENEARVRTALDAVVRLYTGEGMDGGLESILPTIDAASSRLVEWLERLRDAATAEASLAQAQVAEVTSAFERAIGIETKRLVSAIENDVAMRAFAPVRLLDGVEVREALNGAELEELVSTVLDEVRGVKVDLAARLEARVSELRDKLSSNVQTALDRQSQLGSRVRELLTATGKRLEGVRETSVVLSNELAVSQMDDTIAAAGESLLGELSQNAEEYEGACRTCEEVFYSDSEAIASDGDRRVTRETRRFKEKLLASGSVAVVLTLLLCALAGLPPTVFIVSVALWALYAAQEAKTRQGVTNFIGSDLESKRVLAEQRRSRELHWIGERRLAGVTDIFKECGRGLQGAASKLNRDQRRTVMELGDELWSRLDEVASEVTTDVTNLRDEFARNVQEGLEAVSAIRQSHNEMQLEIRDAITGLPVAWKEAVARSMEERYSGELEAMRSRALELYSANRVAYDSLQELRDWCHVEARADQLREGDAPWE